MILPFSKIGKNDAPKAGGKGASLGEMTQAGIPVPPGFVVLAEAFESFLDTNSLRSEINQILGNIDHNSVTSIEGASEKIQELIKNGQIPSEIKKEIQKYQETLDATFVAVRSSATAEDGAEHAWAGQLDTYLNVAKGDVEKKIQSCWASLFTPRALFYRSEKGLGEVHISVAVVVQSMVDAESAGVAFSVHPVTENLDEIVIEGSWGLGEAVVSGEVTPDSFVISKSRKNMLSEHIAEKKKGIFRNKDGQNEWLEIDTEKREKPILTKEKIQALSDLIIQIENHYGFPCDIEWAHSKEKIYILQARPITTLKKISTWNHFPQGVVKMGRWALPLLSSECWNSEVTQQRFFEKIGIHRQFIVLHEINPDFQNPYYNSDFFCALSERIESMYVQDKKALFNKINTFYAEEKEAKKAIDILGKIDFKKVSNKKLANIFLENRRLVGYITVYDQLGWLCENHLYVQIVHILENKGILKSSEEFNKYQFSLTQPEHISTTLKEKLAVFQACERIKDGKSKIEDEAVNLAQEFGFMPVFAYGVAWDKNYYDKQLKDILNQGVDIKKEISVLNDYSVKQRKDFEQAVQDLSLNSQQKQRFVDFGLILDARNEAEYFVSYSGKQFVELLRHISQRLDISEKELLNLTKAEIVSLLLRHAEKKDILSRRGKISGWGYLDDSGVRRLFDGEEAEKIFTLFEQKKIFIQGNSEEKGVCGSPGIARGKIRITRSPSENDKVKNGDILVTYATTVDYLPAMKKAGAIITEVGGITCHAAVVSREFGIPCIIAFKNAMESLQDGDLVEVDADNGIVRVLEKKKNIFTDNWQLGATRNMPLWHDILCLYGWEDNMRDYGVDEKCKCLFAIENATHATMFMLPENQKKYFAATAECCKNGKAVRELRKKYERYAAEVQHDLKQLAEKQNEKNWQKFFKSYQRFTAGLWITTGFGRIGTEKLGQELTKSGIQKEKIPEYIGLLTYPEEHTPLFLSQRDMLIIGNKIQKNKKTDTKKELQKWLEKHKYIPVNYCEDPWTLADAQEHLRNILEQDCEIALQKLEISHEKKIQARKKLGKKYGKNIREIGDALAEATSLNEYRKNIFCRLSYSIRYIFETIMKQIGSSDWRDAYYCTPEEILAIVGGESIDIQSVKDERKKCVFVREGDTITWGDTEQVQKFFGKIYNTSEAISEKLQGFSANTGKITGTVKIVLSTKDFYKVQRGDILVTTMTSVDFVPIMEKAGAFVTNEGGITSHAAIVAREMDKPCIIGTKHATRMLKDGDLVEVDADNGVVKILKNNSEPDFSHKNLEVWIERKQSIFSMSVFHELESEVMKQYLGGGFRTQICFMKDKICSYIHEIGDFENVVNAIAKKIKNNSEQEIREMIEKMNSWEKIGKKIIKEGHTKVMTSKVSRKKYLEDYKNIGYWTTVVPYFLLEAINTIENQTAYKDLKTVCERLRGNSLYPILNEEITHKILEELTDTLGLEKGDWYYITWHETMNILEGNMPQNIESIEKRKNKENAFYRSKNGEVIFLENKENIQNLSEISYPKNTVNTINGVTAYPGKVQGKVKILRTTSDMRDFKQGDILVSPNSNPSLMSCIKKCGAMITDEGGVSCHAAIISRELRKPCIIGTKIATKVLKDGDVVEVDADNGNIKIMNGYIKNSSVTRDTKLFSMRDRPQLLAPVYWNGIVQSSRQVREIYDYSLSEIFMLFENGRQKMFFIEDEWNEMADKISSKILEEDGFFEEIEKKEKQTRNKIEKFLNIEKIQEKQSYRNKIKDLFIEYDAITVYAWFLAGDVIRNKIKNTLKISNEESDILFLPEKPTYVAKMEEDVLLGAKDKDLNSAEKLSKKYYWIPFGYNGPDIWDEKYFKKEINKISKKDAEKKILEIQAKRKETQKLKNDIYIKHKFQNKEIKLIEIMKTITEWTDTRKMLDFQLFHRYYKSLELVSSETQTPIHILQEFFTEDLNILNTGNVLKATQREKGKYILHYKGGNVEILSNEDADRIREIINEKTGGEIQGKVACKGGKNKIQAKVKICHTAKEASLIPEGYILVTSMTTPDYAVGMNRAYGFVTDEGGVTCHAAIVAREMNKPCIIATKNATRLLNDDDLIQINLIDGTVKILEKMREIQWGFTYDRQMSYQRIELFHCGYCEKLSEYFDVSIENELYRIKNGLVSVFYDEIGHKEAFTKIRGLLSGKYRKEWYQRMHRTITEDYKKFISFLNKGEEKENQENLRKELQAYMNQNRDISLSTWLLYGYIEEILSDRLKELLQKKINSNWEEVFDILSRPDEIIPADSWEYDTALACVATSSEKEKKIKEIYTKYRSYGMYDVMFEGKTPEAIDKKIKDKSSAAHDIIKEIENKYALQKKALKKIQNIDWNETEKELIKLYRLYANFKDWKNFHRERSSYQIQEVYKNIAQKFHIKTEALWYMTAEEIGEGIQKNRWISEVEIEKRKTNSAWIFTGISTRNITDTHELDQLDDGISVKKNILQGNTAYPGKIRGKARIINSPSDLENIVTGEILVSSTTRPDYLPFMSKIAGFITNEGGTLSHAAILAREIKKPCIIGTKVATQVIRTGQTIKLDATAGIVTIEKDDYFDDKKLLSEGGRACYLYPNRIFCTRMNIPHPLWENHLMVISTSENHKVNWYFAVNDESEFDYTLERVLKKPNMLQEGEKEINKLVQKAEKTLKKEYKNQKEAGKGYENFIKIYEEIAIVPTFVRQLDRAVVRSLREVITNEEDFAVATYPTKRTYQRQEEVLLLELRTRMGEKITPDVQQNLHEIYSTYFTSGLGYFEEQVKTIENYEERLLGITKEEARESLGKIQTEEKEMIRKKKELKKKFPEKTDVIDVAGFLVYLKDHYKFQINRVQHYSEGLWKSMADITGYTENFLRDLTPEEIQNLIQNNTIDEEVIQERIACHAYVYNEQGEPELIIGKKAQDFIQKYLKTNKEQKEFSGRIACKGHGTGKAKIILGTRDFHKMEQGDILVVMNTSPDFVPIMKKAAAIVAEEGGITGHVSVVSREFGIPSVVGIKQITSIIQDGEIIEVDAEKGVVIRHN